MSTALFQPFRLRSTEFRNRLWVPPMCQYSADTLDGRAGEWHRVHYGAMSRGGAGAIIIEATAVTPEGRISPYDLGLWDDDHVESLTTVVETIHSHGAKVGIQLAHAGRKGSSHRPWSESDPGTAVRGSLSSREGGWDTIAPSAIEYPGFCAPHAASVSDIERVIDAFALAAQRAEAAGVDFVEIHAAHGYLIHEFLSPLSNTRDDSYGGALENRARFLREIVEAVRGQVSDTMPLVVRMSATDWAEGGVTIDESIEVARWLKDDGVDLLSVSAGGNVSGVSVASGPGYLVPIATAIREVVGIPTATVGFITRPEQAEQIVLTGLADVVLVGREFLRDPHFGLRAAQELGAHIPYLPAPYQRAYR